MNDWTRVDEHTAGAAVDRKLADLMAEFDSWAAAQGPTWQEHLDVKRPQVEASLRARLERQLDECLAAHRRRMGSLS